VKNYQLSIKLLEIQPPIWRRFVVPGTVSLAKLHSILQKVMGWENYHIYLFNVGRQQYGEGISEWGHFDQRVVNAKRVMLLDIAVRKGARFFYTYDMGDGWEHEIRVEEIREGPPEQVRCIEGERSCPPEDCGGPYGYQQLLEIIFDPKHPEHQERRDWLGDSFSPELFNVEIVNRRLKRLKIAREAA
jgi:hypothetical protein